MGSNEKVSYWLSANFLLVLFGTLGSLFFSEVMKFPPCVLCWYQRIALYPLVLIFGVALWSGDIGYRKYALPLNLAGLALAFYHNLLYFGVIPEGLVPCTPGASCSAKHLELFGILTIPLMSLCSFVLSTIFILRDRRVQSATPAKLKELS